MYKTRDTGTGNGMRGTRGIWGMLYSGECCQVFRGMSSNIPRNVAKFSGECHRTFRGMLLNIPWNVAKHSGECRQIFREMSSNIPGNVLKHLEKCCQTFWDMSLSIPGNVCVTQGNEDARSVQDFMEFVVHGICSRRLKYSKAVEVRSNYKKSYLGWFGNPACGDWTGSNRIEKDRVRVPPEFVWGKRGEKWWCNFVCVERLGLMLVLLMSFSRMMSMILVLRGVGPIVDNGYEI